VRSPLATRSVVIPTACAALCALSSCRAATGSGPAQAAGFRDDFSAGSLDPQAWARTHMNDFETEIVEVAQGRLRLAASSVGTNDLTVKWHGVRSRRPVVEVEQGSVVRLTLGWNGQANGCYMTADAYICPTPTQDPEHAPSWVRISYIGVPPGRNARCHIAVRARGRERTLLTEGWPEQRTGR
jgi:hypothetical protein